MRKPASTFNRWIAAQWNALVSIGLADEERAKHLRWHLHATNMEKVRRCIARYFAKYLGKPMETVFEEIPERWWGRVNGQALPLSACSQVPLPERAAIFAHRIARKLLEKRADEARHRAIARALGLVNSKGEPLASQFRLLGMRTRIRNLNARNIDWNSFPAGTQRALDWLVLIPAQKGLKWGKAKRSSFARFSRVKLISSQSPAAALQIMRFVGNSMREWIERYPF